jgi:hypothetical protein
MFKCSQCGNETFFKESNTVSRCSACFTKTSASDFKIVFSNPEKLQSPNPIPAKKNHYYKYGLILFSLLIYFFVSQYALDFMRSSVQSVNSNLSEEEESKAKVDTLVETSESKEIPSENFILTELTPLPDSIGNLYFVGYIENISTIPAEKPKVELYFYDKKNQLITSTFGYAAKDILDVNEKSMLNILLKDAPKFDRYESKIIATKLYYERKNPKIELIQSKVISGENGLKIVGSIKNANEYSIQYINLTMILRDKKKKIIHFSDHYLKEDSLGPNKELPFEIELYIHDIGHASHELNFQALKKE